MTWEIKIYNPNRSTLLRTLTPDAPGGLDAGFEWQLDPHGGTANLQLAGRNDTLGIPPRGVVTLTVDGVPQFHGIVPDAPSLGSPDAETVLVAGGVEALRVTLMDGAVYRNQGVYQIARDILSRLCPPALVYDATQMGDGSGTDAGPVLDTFYSPTAALSDVLKALADSAKVAWGADALGRPFLGRPAAPALAVAYAGQPWRRLPSQGREAVTQAVLRIVSAPSVSEGLWNVVAGVVTPYLPKTVSVTATHAQHGTYRATQSYDTPAGTSVLASRAPRIPAGDGTQNITNPSAAIDGDPDTYASGSGSTWRVQYFQSGGSIVVGVRITYGLTLASGANVSMYVRTESNLTGVNRNVTVLQATLAASAEPVAQTIILPPDARHGTWQAFELSLQTQGPTTIHIHEVVFLTLDEPAAQRTAESYLQVPYASPAEITLPGLIPPSPTVSVTGSPDGDVTADAGLFVYRISDPDGRQTLVRLGSTGQNQMVRALKWAVRQ